MGLNFVAPMIFYGESIAKLVKKDVNMMTESWQNALLVYVVRQNPNLITITNYHKSQWAPVDERKLFKHDEGYFVMKLDSRKDRDVILYSGPHLFFGKAMIVRQWIPNISFH